MMDRGPAWQRPWHVSSLLWNSAASLYFPVRLYMRIGDYLLFHAWLRSRPLVWYLEDRLGATGSSGGEP
jgi:hypothetical protein